MRLLIDLGNTRVKWAWQATAEAELLDPQAAPHQHGHCADLLEQLQQRPPQQAWLSSVAGSSADRLSADLRAAEVDVVLATSPPQLDGWRNAYDRPERLGVDRFLAMLGARMRHPASNLLVVDAGTALTIDLLDADGQHHGGSIAPGLALMRSALGNGTATLGAGLDPSQFALHSLARSTAQAIEIGIFGAAIGAIQLRMMQLQAFAPMLLLSGGDASLLASQLPGAEVAPLLVLEGLARYAGLFQEQG